MRHVRIHVGTTTCCFYREHEGDDTRVQALTEDGAWHDSSFVGDLEALVTYYTDPKGAFEAQEVEEGECHYE